MTHNWLWVDTSQKRQEALEDVSNAPEIAIDTEYDSLRYFRDKLCLLQVGTGDRTYLFDPLNRGLDFTFLGKIFRSSAHVKVLHAGDNDVRILKRDYGFEFRNVFDTQRAAALLGSDLLALSTVIESYLGVSLNKAKRLQRSRWENRPLTEEQIDYAVRDTAFLIDLYRKMKPEIVSRGLEDQARRAFTAVCSARWNEKAFDERSLRGIKGYQDLEDAQRGRLKALYRWRFEKAKITNTARFMILSDQNLLDIATSDVKSVRTLERLCGLTNQKAELIGPEILEILEELSLEG
ncbi:MAG TPA: ribonuclease D [Syntrophales bacterium]|nr:ribonuclease D [Syntrophales bacterium]HOX93491.1 ribonuclease D [Syntrophales bacterium]HPI57539.1 ribonuclease D [Syntrophales bacterium]HPN24696.1 ribonuclease D [Syntrophales bacterium]HQM29827.1 ribonuclease D [Syntrophales bacterium]